ncbi:hypothetical protein, partial [Bacillus sp. MUM 116]|uniref:hypothetical protein n=1 Tax=Bacillus sp. MUM 116 TaxID=1678002 RepID=UPI001C4324EE
VVSGGNNYYLSTIFLTLICLGQGSLISKIGEKSLGIYVLHVFLINISNTILTHFDMNFLRETIFWNILFPLCIFIFSYYSYVFIKYIGRNIKLKKFSSRSKATY